MYSTYSYIQLYLIKAINVEGNTVIDMSWISLLHKVEGGIQMLIICVYPCRVSRRHCIIKIPYLHVIQCCCIGYSFSVYKYNSFNYEEIDRLFSYYSINFFFFYARPPPSFLWNQIQRKEKQNETIWL